METKLETREDLEEGLIPSTSRPAMAAAQTKPCLVVAVSMVAVVACVASYIHAVFREEFGLEGLLSFVLLLLATVLSAMGWARSLTSPTLAQVLDVWARVGMALVAGLAPPLFLLSLILLSPPGSLNAYQAIFFFLFVLSLGCFFISGCLVFYDALKHDVMKWLSLWNALASGLFISMVVILIVAVGIANAAGN